MTWLRRSDRLVTAAVLASLIPAWVALVGFDALMAFAAEIDEIGEGGYTAANAAFFTLYTLPRRAYQLFPPAALVGSLLGLGSLAATSELTALRAAGLSRIRICLGAAIVLTLLTALMVLVAETIGPAGEQRAQSLVLAAKTQDIALARWSGLWAREGDTILNARYGRVLGEGAETRVELDDVRLYEFEPNGNLNSIALAKRAEHRLGQWTLFEVRRTTFAQDGVETAESRSERWISSLDPAVLSLTVTRPRYLATREIAAGLEYQKRNGLDSSLFENAYWARWFYPLNALVLCLAAMPFAFGPLRSGGLGLRLFLGIAIGLGYFMLQTLVISAAEVYRVDLRVGNLIPPLLAMLASWMFFRKRA